MFYFEILSAKALYSSHEKASDINLWLMYFPKNITLINSYLNLIYQLNHEIFSYEKEVQEVKIQILEFEAIQDFYKADLLILFPIGLNTNCFDLKEELDRKTGEKKLVVSFKK